ncbi:hypothetical protein CBS101457_006916 [Exobasidium rhododendri]|nr:hypothetical protein CBS101457_006916 [Exobasidium rhododendri]
MSKYTSTKTVLVLGASYGGHRAIQMLVACLPLGWRVVALERNTHFNHLYAFPRMSVVPGHEHKIFIPYTKLFSPISPPAINANNVLIHGNLSGLSASRGTEGKPAEGRGVAEYTPAGNDSAQATEKIPFDYLIYALGNHLPPSINLWSIPEKKQEELESKGKVNGSVQIGLDAPQTRGTKTKGVKYMQEAQAYIAEAESILVVGAGALGVQYASDIAWTYGTATSPARWTGHKQPPKPKKITLLSSSSRILPRFQVWMHEEGVRSLEELGVEVITGSRADMSTLDDSSNHKKRTVKTLDGREIEAELVLFCTGQRTNTDYLLSYGDVVNPKTGLAAVNPFLQLKQRDSGEVLENVFVIGDAADAFGALNAGHTAFAQAEVAARNVARLVTAEEGQLAPEQKDIADWVSTPLEAYHPEAHRIKVSVGIEKTIRENNGNNRMISDGVVDLNAPNMWLKRGLEIDDMTV